MGPTFVETLPVGKFHGIGPATAAKLQSFGIHSGLDLRNQTLSFLEAHFGKAGAYFYSISRGIDDRPVRSNRIRKSVGAETTFSQDLTDFDTLAEELGPLIDKVWSYCEKSGVRGRTVTLKVKFADFEIISRSHSLVDAVSDRADIEAVTRQLLKNLLPLPKAVRLLGVALSAFQADQAEEVSQLSLCL